MIGVGVLLLIGALAQPVSAWPAPQPGYMTLTGYDQISFAGGSKSPVTVTVNARNRAAIYKALRALSFFPPGSCVETIDTFSIGFLLKRTTHPRDVAREDACPTPGVVGVTIGGQRAGDFKADCALNKAVLAALPSGRANATRQYLQFCS